ncbi:MAG: hypothetical protein ABUL72_02240, partial [Armatimonadota bacterium]
DGDGELLRLDHERFSELVRLDPNIGLALSASLSRRLGVASQNIKDSEHLVRGHVEQQLARLAPHLRTLLLRASILDDANPASLQTLFGADAGAVSAGLAELGWRKGRAPAAVAATLRAAYAREAGAETVRAFALAAIDTLSHAQHWQEALALAENFGTRPDFVAMFGRALRSENNLPPERVSRWLQWLTDDEAASDPVLAAGRNALREAQLTLDAGTEPQRRARVRKVWERIRSRPSHLLAGCASILFIVAAIAVAPFSKPIAFVLLLAAAIVLWVVAIFPEFVVYLGLVVAWVFLGIASPGQAVAGFGSTAWISILSIL